MVELQRALGLKKSLLQKCILMGIFIVPTVYMGNDIHIHVFCLHKVYHLKSPYFTCIYTHRHTHALEPVLDRTQWKPTQACGERADSMQVVS